MKRGITGKYIETGTVGERVYAFIPFPLPPVPEPDLRGKRSQLLEKAIHALGKLDSIGLLLPDPHIFLYAYIRREAVLSSQIEGTQSSLSDLLLYELEASPGVPFEDVTEVSNYVRALEHGIERLRKGFPLCNRLIREMHATLLSSGRGSGKNPGEYRRSQNWIGGTRPGNAVFVPPPPERVEECMSDLEKFINESRNSWPALIKAALVHVQFETIHPFLDGNGRIGRLLIPFILFREGILQRPLLYLSLFFKQHRNEYYRLLDVVRKEGDWEAWLDFFLEGVYEVASNAVETAQRLVALFKEDTRKIQTSGRPAGTVLRVFDTLCERPILSLGETVRRTGLSFPAASKGMNILLSLEICREITGQKRNRIFAYDSYMKILNEGIEPL